MSGSLRHPHVSLRDTIAIKLLVLSGTVHGDATPEEIRLAREIVDDLAEYIREGE